MQIARRIALVILAYAGASVAVGIMLSMPWWVEKPNLGVPAAVSLMAAVGAIPVIPGLACAEYCGTRRYLYYAVCGALAGLVPLLVFAPPGPVPIEAFVVYAWCATAGLLGGTVYWLIAGRTAGIRRSMQTEMLVTTD